MRLPFALLHTLCVFMCQCVFASSVGLVSVCHDCIPTWGVGPFCCAHPGTAKKKKKGGERQRDEEEEQEEGEEEEEEEEEGVVAFN